jgi:hypothetical protein
LSKFAEHVPGHEMPAGVLTTLPEARLASTVNVIGT